LKIYEEKNYTGKDFYKAVVWVTLFTLNA